MPAMSRSPQRVVLSVAWLLIAAVIAVGAAGLVAATANQPGTAGRGELTLDGDTTAGAALAAAQADLTDRAADVDRLGELGRGALAALASSDFASLDGAVADGEILARAIDDRSAQLRERIRLVPGTGPLEAILWSPEILQRRDLVFGAVEATGGLEASWSRLAAGASVANRLTTLLVDHDTTTGKAAAESRTRKYAAALKTLATAIALLDQAGSLRDALANTVDVGTLTQWIDRNAEYDTAFGALLTATIESNGKVTTKLKNAALAERRAQSLLPANTSGLVIILAEISRGGLNQAVIGIEETRARLQAAVDRLTTPPSEAPGANPPD